MSWMMTRFLFVALMLLCLLLSGCGSKFFGITYAVDIVNYGQSGVLILQVGDRKATGFHNYYHKRGVTFPIILGRHPSIPSKYRNPADAFGRFKGYPDSLPEELEVVWQLAELRDCRKELWADEQGDYSDREWKVELEKFRALGYNPSDHVMKSGCTWVPQSDKIYRKTLDMAAIKETEAYKNTGKRNPEVAMSRYTLNITLIFNEDQLTVEAANSTTNPWK